MRDIDLTPFLDLESPLPNPGKGWYHHQIDNGSLQYMETDMELLNAIPGMDHGYLRVSWGQLEPSEGNYRWEILDREIERFTSAGLGFSLRITSRETGEAFSTPEWVFNKGAKYSEHENWGLKTTCPDYGDGIFLEELRKFFIELGKRYAGHPALRYIDLGTYGDWGECHNSFSTYTPATKEAILSHFQIHRDCFPHNQIIVSDDLFDESGSDEADRAELLEYIVQHHIGFRDDSILVGYYVENFPESHSVREPRLFEESYAQRLVVLELQHYPMMINPNQDFTWRGINGSEQGFDMLKGAIKTMHASYLGYHGSAQQWLLENPDVSGKLLNLCGYYFVPQKLCIDGNQVELTLENQGVAPNYFDIVASCNSGSETQTELLKQIQPGIQTKIRWTFARISSTLDFGLRTATGNEIVRIAIKENIKIPVD